MEFLTTPDFKLNSLIKIIGLGGAGGNAVKHMAEIGIKDVDYIICNTDAQALENSPIATKIHMGASLTKGRGAGNKPEIGLNAAIESIDDIKAAIGVDTKMVFITAGMGGGTGTGASPVVAEACRELGILTVGIVVTPFNLEGPKRIKQANEGLEKLASVVDCLMVISNDSILTNYGNMAQSKAFALADDVVATAAKSIAEIITISGNTNVDFADVETVLRDSGVAIMGSGLSKGENRAVNAVEQALSSPLLTESNIFGAQNILLNIGSGHQEVTMDEIALIINHLQEAAGGEANLIWGSYIDDHLEDNLHLTVLATGFKKKPDAIAVKKIELEVKDQRVEVEFEAPKSNLFVSLPGFNEDEKPFNELVDIKINRPSQESDVSVGFKKELFVAVEVTPSVEDKTIIQPTVKETIRLDEVPATPSGEAADQVNNLIRNIHETTLEIDNRSKAKPNDIEIKDELLISLDSVYDNESFTLINKDTQEVIDSKPSHTTPAAANQIQNAPTPGVVSGSTKDKLSQLKGVSNLGETKSNQRLGSLKDFNNVNTISDYENTPSYQRKNVSLNTVPSSAEAQNSTLSVGVNNKTVIHTNNSYLNKRID